MRFHRLSVLAVFLLVSLAALVFTKNYPAPKPATQEVVLINKTSAFEVVRAELVGTELTLSLKNNYAQSITAFAFSVGDSVRITEEFVVADSPEEAVIQPQQTFVRKYPLSPKHATETITLQVVVLNDKSGDGDPAIFEDIRDDRLGQAVQIKRALKVFEKYSSDSPDLENLKRELRVELQRPELETVEAIKELHPLGTINRKSREPLSDSVKQGLEGGQNEIFRRIDEAMVSPYEENPLLKIKRYYAALLKRL